MAEVVIFAALGGLCVGVASSSAVAYFEDKPVARVVAPPEAPAPEPAPEPAPAEALPAEDLPAAPAAPPANEEDIPSAEAEPPAEPLENLGVPEEKPHRRKQSLITKFLPQRLSKTNIHR